MMAGAGCAALALPVLSPAVPLKMLITGQDDLVAPLTIALLEADLITNAMLRHPKNSTLVNVFEGVSARDISMRALSKWWSDLVRDNSCNFFRWQLHVQNLDSENIDPAYRGAAWFVFTRISGEIPRFALERRITQLEQRLEGFGQTVLAVLMDATMRLPENFNPWRAVDFAEYYHWNYGDNDEELLEEHRLMNGYATVQEVIDNDGVLTRAEFYQDMPRWVTAPQRTVARDTICELNLTLFELRVVAACDAIAELVGRPSFTLGPWDKGAHRAGSDSTDGAMVLLWRDGDVIGRVTDDVLNDLCNSGDCNDFIDANPVAMTAAGIREFQDLTTQMMQLAVLTEKLILLVGERI